MAKEKTKELEKIGDPLETKEGQKGLEIRKTFETIAKKFGTAPGVLAGVTVHNNWAKGKQLTEAEYKTAVDHFLKAPAKKGGINAR